jgi:ABC-2 type transport system permease protein
MSAESVIHDIGYQRYDGPRLGRGYAVRSLFAHGLRVAFGLGRSAKAKIFPWTVIALVGLIAVILAVAKAQGEQVNYEDMPQIAGVLCLVFLAVVAPELVSRDLRNTLLPLYFSRPIHRSDYALAKLAAMVTATWLLLAGPLTLIFAAGAFGSGDVMAELGGLLKGYTVAAFYAVIFSTIAILIASIASRRAFAAGAIAAVFLVTLPITGILAEVGDEGDASLSQLAALASPVTLPEGLRQWVFGTGEFDIGRFGPLYGAVGVLLPTVCVLLLLLRYRKVSL